MSEIVVVDAEGKRISRAVNRHRPSCYRPSRPVNPVATTLENISALEDAIYEVPEFRIEFLNVYKSLDEPEETLEMYLMKHHTRKKKALIHCWEELGWRPSKDRKRVIRAKNNPYMK